MHSPRSASPKAAPTRGREPLPAHLPLKVIRHEAACVCPVRGGSVVSQLAEYEREMLECVPSHFEVIKYVRPKLGYPARETIVLTPCLPSQSSARGRAPGTWPMCRSPSTVITGGSIARASSAQFGFGRPPPAPCPNWSADELPTGPAGRGGETHAPAPPHTRRRHPIRNLLPRPPQDQTGAAVDFGMRLTALNPDRSSLHAKLLYFRLQGLAHRRIC